MDRKIVSNNKKAFHDFTIFDKFIAGIVLTGTEIKSVRAGAVNLKDSFAKIENGEVWLYNSHISVYDKGNRYNHSPERVRKLLLTKKEIIKLDGKIKKEKYTIVPLLMFLSGGFAKLEIALAKGKKLYDKRETAVKKTQNREIDRALKSRG